MFEKLNDKKEKYTDERGFLEVLYEKKEVVLKRSFSSAGVFRGMHYQEAPFQQTKIIRVIAGKIIDFVADVENISAGIQSQIIVPEDGWIEIKAELAHGFYAVEDTNFEYFCIGKYNPECEKTYSIAGYLLNRIGMQNLILSKKDQMAPMLWNGNFHGK